MYTFDVASMLNATFEGSNSTSQVPVPVGEYPMLIEEVKLAEWKSRDDTKSGLKLQVIMSVEDQAVKELLGRDKVVIRQEIMLDMTETGGLDMGKGKNVNLGKLREATDLNSAGQPFGFSMLVGRQVKGRVSHRPATDGSDTIFAEVKQVAKL